MKLSWIRAFQWIGILAVLVFVIALRYEAPSEAGMQMNASPDSPLSQSLRGYWKLDDGSGTNATDASGNANTLAMTGSPSWTTGNIGPYALDFSGTGQYLSVADPSSGVLDFVDGADFSISGWFNRDTFTADHTIVAKKTNQTTGAGYVVWIDNNGSTDYLSVEISDGTDTYSAIGTTDLSATGWHHFSVIWDDSNGLYIYLDGKLDGSTTNSTSSIGDISNAIDFHIGVTAVGNSGIEIQSSAQSGSQNILVPTGAEIMVVTASFYRNATNWISANPLSLNGSDLTTSQKTDDQSTNGQVWIGYIVSPSTGNQTFSWNWGNTLSEGANISITFWKGVDTSNPIVSSGKQATSNSDLTGLTAGSNDMMVGAVYAYSSAPTVTDSGQVQISNMGIYNGGAMLGSANKNGGTGFYFSGGDYTTCAALVMRASGSNPVSSSLIESASFDGKLDDIRVYGYTLSADQVKKLYNTTSPTQPIDTSLVGHWTFDGNDIQETTAIDRSSYGNNGTITGATKTIGKLGQGLSFDGSGDYITIPDNNSLDMPDGQDFTISGWCKRSDDSNWLTIIRKRGDGTNGYQLEFAASTIWAQIASSGGGYTMYSYSFVTVGEWTHFAFVWDDDNESNTTIYYDGQPTSVYRSGTFSAITDMSNSSSFRIGASWDASGAFYGALDDVRIYNQALSSTEIMNQYMLGR